MLRSSRVLVSALTVALMLSGINVWAQSASGIAGVVRDTSGAVLPGVTVEAASPALIEKVRTVVTDGEGRYNIVDLRPGTYMVTFTLAGFSTSSAKASSYRRVHRHGQRRPAGRRARGDDHRHRRDAAGRHAERAAAEGRLERAARRAADRLEGRRNSRHPHARADRRRRTSAARPAPTPIGRHGRRPSTARPAPRCSSTACASTTWKAPGSTGYIVNSAAGRGDDGRDRRRLGREQRPAASLMNMIPKEGGNTFRGSFIGPVRERRSAERQPDRRAARARADDRQQGAASSTTPAGSLGGPIMQGQAVVLRR